MGERSKYVGEGRFGDKGGRQVGSAFEASTHNEKIKHIYGNFGFWSWFRYWYLDSANYVTMLLIDKGYFDYDFEWVEVEVKWEDTVKTDEEVHDMLAMFGMGRKAPKKLKTKEEIQNHIIKLEGYGS